MNSSNGGDLDRFGWLPDMDLNHDKQIQSLLCYRYTIGQTGRSKVGIGVKESRKQTSKVQPPMSKTSQIPNPKSQKNPKLQIPKLTAGRCLASAGPSLTTCFSA